MNKKSIKYFIGCGVPVFVCNFRCEYCYLGQHPDTTSKGIVPFAQSSEYIADFFSVDKMGGVCYFNFCASGETMMHPELIDLVYLLTKDGHYVDIISNGTLSNKYDELIARLDSTQRKHIMIKFSFHYLELKRLQKLDVFVDNVVKVKNAEMSYSIEITPHDNLIPYIQEIKEFSLDIFGAYPHITVARNEATKRIEILSKLARDEYEAVWSDFKSDMFDFKFKVFNQKRSEFCYAGLWSLQLNLRSGDYYQCYGGDLLGNIRNKNLKLRPIGKCRQPHCFNAHAYLTYGVIPKLESPTYCQMRDRIMNDGCHWIQEDTREFFNTKLCESNEILSEKEKKQVMAKSDAYHFVNKGKKLLLHIPNKFKRGKKYDEK